MRTLTEKRRRFVEAYTGEAKGNGVMAARIAGYKGNDATLAVTAAEILRNPKVAVEIRAAAEEVRSKAIAARRERMRFLTRVMRGEADEEVVVVEGTGDGCSEATKIRKQVSTKERLKAAELLGRMQGDFIDKVEVKAAGWLKGALDQVRRRAAAGEFKHLTEEALGELFEALGGL